MDNHTWYTPLGPASIPDQPSDAFNSPPNGTFMNQPNPELPGTQGTTTPTMPTPSSIPSLPSSSSIVHLEFNIPSYDHYLAEKRSTTVPEADKTYTPLLDNFYAFRIGPGGPGEMTVPFLVALVNRLLREGNVVDPGLKRVTGEMLGCWERWVASRGVWPPTPSTPTHTLGMDGQQQQQGRQQQHQGRQQQALQHQAPTGSSSHAHAQAHAPRQGQEDEELDLDLDLSDIALPTVRPDFGRPRHKADRNSKGKGVENKRQWWRT